MKPIFYSQIGEDLLIYKKLINKNVNDGIFVELGAMDGVRYSNSKFFEDKLGFTGILIEPSILFNKLNINRPKCQNYNYAISQKEEQVVFIGDDATAGILDNIPQYMYNRYHRGNSTTYKVNGIPIHKIISESQIDHIDVFFIDVEGGELLVLNTIDWNIPIYIIVIELHDIDKEKDNKCRVKMAEHGFKFYVTLCTNEIWINDKYEYKNRLFDESIQFENITSLDSVGYFPHVEEGFISRIISTVNSV